MAGLFDTLDAELLPEFPDDGNHNYIFARWNTKDKQLFLNFKMEEPGSPFHQDDFMINFWVPNKQDQVDNPTGVQKSMNITRKFFKQMGIAVDIMDPTFTDELQSVVGSAYVGYGKAVDDEYRGRNYKLYNVKPLS